MTNQRSNGKEDAGTNGANGGAPNRSSTIASAMLPPTGLFNSRGVKDMNGHTNTGNGKTDFVPIFTPITEADLRIDDKIEVSREERQDSWVWSEQSLRTMADSLISGAKAPRVGVPTLIIGWGGTGKRQLTMVKVRLIETYGAVPGNVMLLCFDSDSRDPVAYRESRFGKVVQLEPGREMILLEGVNIAGIKRAPEKHVEFYAGLSAEIINAIQRSFITYGAAQDRTQGCAFYRWHGLTIENIVHNALRRLLGRSDDLRDEHAREDAVQIFFAGSMFGGQGSGALIDHALVINEQLEDLSVIGENSTVIGVFVEPSSFHANETASMRANAASFAIEVNKFMRNELRPNVRYAGRKGLRTKERPFSHVFTFSGWDASGKSWPNHDEVCAVSATTIWLLTCTPVGAKEIGASLNKRNVLGGVSSEGFGTYLASAGTVSLRFSGREAANLCAARAARSVLTGALDASAGRSTYGTAVVGLGAVKSRLQNNADNLPYQPKLSVPADLEQAPVDTIPDKARKYVDNYFTRRVYAEMFAQMREKASALHDQVKGNIASSFESLLAQGNLPACAAWVDAQRNQAGQELDRMNDEQAAATHAVAQAQAQADGALGAMMRLAEGPSIITRFRRNEMLALLTQYLDRAGALARLRLEQRAIDEATALVHSAHGWLADAQRLVNDLNLTIHQACEDLMAFEADCLARKGSRTEINIADAAVLDELYAAHAANAEAHAASATARTGGLQAWQGMTAEKLAGKMKETMHAAFAPIASMTVEEALQMRWNDRSPQQWLERMEALAAPAWNPDRSLLNGGGVELAQYTTIGVPDMTDSIFADSERTLVSTNNPEQITVLRTVYGASYDALKPWQQWKRDYDELVGKRPLHIYPSVHHDGDRGARLFALGLIYGHIDRNGAWYYYRPADKLLEPVRLAQGLDNAVTTFAAHSALQSELEQRVEEQAAAEGAAATEKRLLTWIERQAKGDETTNLLRRLVRAYAHKRFSPASGRAQS